jgi:disulfide oxidoreductase YuzD
MNFTNKFRYIDIENEDDRHQLLRTKRDREKNKSCFPLVKLKIHLH